MFPRSLVVLEQESLRVNLGIKLDDGFCLFLTKLIFTGISDNLSELNTRSL